MVGGWWVGGKQLKKNCVYQYAIASSRAVLSQSWQDELFYHNTDIFFQISELKMRVVVSELKRLAVGRENQVVHQNNFTNVI